MEPQSDESANLNVEHAPACLFVNAHARSGREQFEQALAGLKARGVELAQAVPLEDPSRLAELVRRAYDAGARRFLVGGGDGSLSCAADVLGGTDAILGVLPLGTANDFARALAIPPELDAACDVIARGHWRHVDLGVVNGRRFLNAASVGLTSEVARTMNPAVKKTLGPLAYPATAAMRAMRSQPFQLRLVTEDTTLDLPSFQLVVGNGRFHGGGRAVAPDASHDDQLLDVYVITARAEEGENATLRDLGALARIGMMLRHGDHVDHPAVIHLRMRRARVECDPPLELDVDGELCGTTPADFSVLPRALRVFAPPWTDLPNVAP